MTSESDALDTPDKTISLSSTAEYMAATVRAQAGWRGWTQRDISRETGLQINYINSRWRGEREWSLADVEKIARSLGMDTWSFFELARTLSRSHIAVRTPSNDVDDEIADEAPSPEWRARNQA